MTLAYNKIETSASLAFSCSLSLMHMNTHPHMQFVTRIRTPRDHTQRGNNGTAEGKYIGLGGKSGRDYQQINGRYW